ncbi:hypothetical protein F7725_008756 [Dissostichus mawsoni]|uniref:Helicase C-terminal domain-containing protein n=1 Tax=Dissostichus mawsoni TaxID=36200 RepID=A0A7J5Y8X2_DISMA|nr:hypothetical protein F7725_008756 [Dissostichus mawsoni]
MKSQKTVQDAVKKLEGPASREVIEEADVLFTDYESKLFSHTVKGQTAIFEEMIEDQEGGLMDDRLPTTSRGLWAASETEKSLKAVLAFAKLKRLDNDLLEEGNTFMELLECWKKEYKVRGLRLLFHINLIRNLDEGAAALRLPDEPKPKLLHIIEPHEVDQNQQKLLNDQALAKSQLQKKLGQVLYLNNLEKGSHSTKVEAVVRTLKKIQLIDPGAKCLVFSTWLSVLDIISKALFDNNMEFSQINGIHKFQEQINILLLPLHTGSNGLNIIEATHVLLVEPILNPAHELQAIGRVHRIGQTKPTFVHRFLIKSTIEERMQAMMKTAEKSHATTMKHSEAAVLTVADLADLFTEEHLDYRGDTEILRELEKMAASRLVFFWILIVLRTAAGFLQEEEEGEPGSGTVLCSNDQMKVVIPSIFFLRKDPPVFVGDLHLNDPECRGVEVGEDYVFSIKTNLRNYVNITFSCRYPVRYLVQQPGGGHGVHVHLRTITLNTEDGNFSVSMLLFKDEAFEDRWTTVPSLRLEDHVFVKIPAHLMLRMEMLGDPSSDPYSNIQYTFIRESCPVLSSVQTLSVLRNGEGPDAAFRLQMFKFVGNSYTNVFLHCNVQIAASARGSGGLPAVGTLVLGGLLVLVLLWSPGSSDAYGSAPEASIQSERLNSRCRLLWGGGYLSNIHTLSEVASCRLLRGGGYLSNIHTLSEVASCGGGGYLSNIHTLSEVASCGGGGYLSNIHTLSEVAS